MEFRFDKTDRQAMSNSVENVSEKENVLLFLPRVYHLWIILTAAKRFWCTPKPQNRRSWVIWPLEKKNRSYSDECYVQFTSPTRQNGLVPSRCVGDVKWTLGYRSSTWNKQRHCYLPYIYHLVSCVFYSHILNAPTNTLSDKLMLSERN